MRRRLGGTQKRAASSAVAPCWVVGYARAFMRARVLRAIDLPAELGRRWKRLLAVAPKLRARASNIVVERLLSDDAAIASEKIPGMSGRCCMQTSAEARHIAREKPFSITSRPTRQRCDQDPAVPSCLSGRIETSTSKATPVAPALSPDARAWRCAPCRDRPAVSPRRFPHAHAVPGPSGLRSVRNSRVPASRLR